MGGGGREGFDGEKGREEEVGEKRKTKANMEGMRARMRRGGLDGRW